MDEPDVAAGLMRLEDLIEPDLHLRVDGTNRATIVGWGLFFAVVHQVRSVLELHRLDACGSGAPNRRSAFEHAVTLRWCADQGDKIGDIFNRKLRGDQIQLANALRAEGSPHRSTDAYQRMVQTVKIVEESIPAEPGERLAKIEHLLDGYGMLSEKTYYQLESRFVHPTLTGAQMFFQDNGEAIVLSQIAIHKELVPCHLFALSVLHGAMLAFNQLLADRPWTADLEKIAQDFGLTSKMPISSGGDVRK
ncbi:hypothetical protein ACFHW1_11970 [Micromonospora sp. LOL_014]|uniref:hypothetical protein n=1 Tax=Micromonospora sp. LOL_014 TaxID=3345415 RepID=UPI003A83C1EA